MITYEEERFSNKKEEFIKDIELKVLPEKELFI